MRLICPNCSAQYEIDATLIPDEGRDVQCSNCGHTWFELPPAPPAFADAPVADVGEDEAAVEAPEAASPASGVEDVRAAEPYEADAEAGEPEYDDAPEDEPEDASEPDAEPEPKPEAQAEPDGDDADTADEPETEPVAEPVAEPVGEPDDDHDHDHDDTERSTAAKAIAAASEDIERSAPAPSDPFAAAAAAGASFQKRRAPDDATLEILREEAERELAQRRNAPSTPLETQTDMEFDEVQGRSTPSRALRARMARERTDEPEAKARGREKTPDPRIQSTDESYEAPRRDLLPDIDEINSSLKARKGRPADPEVADADRRRGFRAGFVLMILLAAVMIFAYAWAPAIAGLVPALEGPLLVYVDWANGVRDWIDGVLGA